VSVIGRFLEHSRVYYFQNDGDPEYFIGSADLMVRNLNERMEALAPIRDPALQAQIHEVLEQLLTDRRQGWAQHDREWTRDPSVTAEGTHELLTRPRVVELRETATHSAANNPEPLRVERNE
jgi:polyphosphate kinase